MCLMHGKGVYYVFHDCVHCMLYMSMCECTLYVAQVCVSVHYMLHRYVWVCTICCTGMSVQNICGVCVYMCLFVSWPSSEHEMHVCTCSKPCTSGKGQEEVDCWLILGAHLAHTWTRHTNDPNKDNTQTEVHALYIVTNVSTHLELHLSILVTVYITVQYMYTVIVQVHCIECNEHWVHMIFNSVIGIQYMYTHHLLFLACFMYVTCYTFANWNNHSLLI